MRKRFFDFEVFPEWWCCVFGDITEESLREDVKDSFSVIRSEDLLAREKLISKMLESDYALFGYNIKKYDLFIANCIYQGFTPHEVYVANCILVENIGTELDAKEVQRITPLLSASVLYKSPLIRRMTYEDLLDDGEGTLKDKEAILGLSVLESSVPFNKTNLSNEEKEEIIHYCKQDVYASMVFFVKIVSNYCRTKLAVGRKFNLPESLCYKSTNALLVCKALNAQNIAFSDAGRKDIVLPDRIKTFVQEHVPYKILDYILHNVEQLQFTLFDNDVSVGDGGLHSVLKKQLYVESDSEWVLLNLDVSSFYPSLMIVYKLLSRTVQNLQLFENIRNERVQIKHKTVKTLEDEETQMAIKLVLNTAYGCSGNEYLPMYDPYMRTCVCRIGELILIAIANYLYKVVPGLRIIQSNTDGILLYCRRSSVELVKTLVAKSSEITGMEFDLDEVVKIWQRDVNNYLMVELEKGKEVVKNRGDWLKCEIRKAGSVRISPLKAFVCAKAAIQWLLNRNDVEESIESCTNLLDFAITCKKGPTFEKVVQRMFDGSEVDCYKSNRLIAVRDPSVGKLYKMKHRGDIIQYNAMPDTPDHCHLINDDISKYKWFQIKSKLDYDYYIRRAQNLLDITWTELSHNSFRTTERFKY